MEQKILAGANNIRESEDKAAVAQGTAHASVSDRSVSLACA